MVQANSSPKQSFAILKVPVSREKQVMYYYKPYKATEYGDAEEMMPAIASPPPADRTIYVVHFL
jgi:hypothetical protein